MYPQPLSPQLRQQIMPCGLPASDARRLLNYFRFDSEGRFLIGARGSFGLHEPASGFERLRRAALHTFPALKAARWEDEWGGLFALTTNFLPHLHQPARNAWMLVGCNGRGIALMSMAARAMGEMASTGNVEACPLPLTVMPHIPLHGLRRPALEVATLWYRMRDTLRI